MNPDMVTQGDAHFEKPARKRPPRTLESNWIFEGEKEVVITHKNQEYRLRVTRADKLILTK